MFAILTSLVKEMQTNPGKVVEAASVMKQQV
jgi:hypothetical protein